MLKLCLIRPREVIRAGATNSASSPVFRASEAHRDRRKQVSPTEFLPGQKECVGTQECVETMTTDTEPTKPQCQGDSAVDLTVIDKAQAPPAAESKGVKSNVSYAQLLRKNGSDATAQDARPADAEKPPPPAPPPVATSRSTPELPPTPTAPADSPTASAVSSPVTSQPAEEVDSDGFQMIKNPRYHRGSYKHQEWRQSHREQREKDRSDECAQRQNYSMSVSPSSTSPKGRTPSRQGSFDAKVSPETKTTSRSSTAVSPSPSEEKPARRAVLPPPTPAPAPAVNVWEVRKEEAAKKAFSAGNGPAAVCCGEDSVARQETRKDSEKPRQDKPADVPVPALPKGVKPSRRSSVVSNGSRTDPVLSFDDPSVWPSVAVSVKEKEQHLKHERRPSDGEEQTKKAVGKSKWIPYTATITHSTPLPGHHFYNNFNNRNKDKRPQDKNTPNNNSGNNHNNIRHHNSSRNHAARPSNDDPKRSASAPVPNAKPPHQQRRRSSNNSHPNSQPHHPHNAVQTHPAPQPQHAGQPHHTGQPHHPAQPQHPIQPQHQIQQHASQQQQAPPEKARENGPVRPEDSNTHGNAAAPVQGNQANGMGGPAFRGNNRRGRGGGGGGARPPIPRMARGRQPIVQAPAAHLQAAYPLHAYLPVAHASGVDGGMAYVYPPAGYGYPAPGLYMPLACPNQMPVSGPPGVPMAVPPGVAAQMVPAVAFDTDTLKYYILAQIEYYFSVPNLVRDAYFRRQMNGDGWVPLSVLAGFNRIRLLTSDISLIRDALLQSSNLEVDSAGLRVRKREGWAAWLFPENQRIPHAAMPSAAPVTVPDVGRRRSGEFVAPAAPAVPAVPVAPASQPPGSQDQGAGVVSF